MLSVFKRTFFHNYGPWTLKFHKGGEMVIRREEYQILFEYLAAFKFYDHLLGIFVANEGKYVIVTLRFYNY